MLFVATFVRYYVCYSHPMVGNSTMLISRFESKCYICDLSPNEWSKELDHTEGRPWTLTRMEDTMSKISNDEELKNIPQNRQGCLAKKIRTF
jgi:hypothetical protein